LDDDNGTEVIGWLLHAGATVMEHLVAMPGADAWFDTLARDEDGVSTVLRAIEDRLAQLATEDLALVQEIDLLLSGANDDNHVLRLRDRWQAALGTADDRRMVQDKAMHEAIVELAAHVLVHDDDHHLPELLSLTGLLLSGANDDESLLLDVLDAVIDTFPATDTTPVPPSGPTSPAPAIVTPATTAAAHNTTARRATFTHVHNVGHRRSNDDDDRHEEWHEGRHEDGHEWHEDQHHDDGWWYVVGGVLLISLVGVACVGLLWYRPARAPPQRVWTMEDGRSNHMMPPSSISIYKSS